MGMKPLALSDGSNRRRPWFLTRRRRASRRRRDEARGPGAPCESVRRDRPRRPRWRSTRGGEEAAEAARARRLSASASPPRAGTVLLRRVMLCRRGDGVQAQPSGLRTNRLEAGRPARARASNAKPPSRPPKAVKIASSARVARRRRLRTSRVGRSGWADEAENGGEAATALHGGGFGVDSQEGVRGGRGRAPGRAPTRSLGSVIKASTMGTSTS